MQELVAESGMAPTRLVLAGGLGGSPYLRRWLSAAYGSSLGQLAVLPDGEAAVMQGAVVFLQKPGIIAACVSSLTYCIQVGCGSAAAAAAAAAVAWLRRGCCCCCCCSNVCGCIGWVGWAWATSLYQFSSKPAYCSH